MKKLKNTKIFFFVSFLYLLFLSYMYYMHITDFSFVDEFNNIIAGFFMTKGRVLYADIFFNHAPLMAVLSFAIQKIFHPNTLYQLIVYHRLFIIIFSLVSTVLLLLRFKYGALGVLVIYETTKYYFFGNLFLAESVIVYALIYLVGLSLEKVHGKKIDAKELLFCAVCAWFVIWMREPFIPLALFSYAYILFGKKITKQIVISLSIFLLLSLATLLSFPVQDFWSQVVSANFQTIIPSNTKSTSMLTILFYPILLLFEGELNYIKVILFSLDGIFFVLLGSLVLAKKYTVLFFIIALLSLANIRTETAGLAFYGAFHSMVWFALFVFTLFFMLFTTSIKMVINKKILYVFLSIIFLFTLLYPNSFIYQRQNKQDTFTLHYARYYTHGEVVRLLKDPKDTLFVDMWDTLVFWQADIASSYKYALYLPVMSIIPKYIQERDSMFATTPPDFYFTDCGEGRESSYLPKNRKNFYTQFFFSGKPTCLYIKKDKVTALSKEKLEAIKKMGYYLPPLDQ